MWRKRRHEMQIPIVHSAARYGNVDLYYEQFYSKVIGTQASKFMSFLASYPHRIMEKNKKNVNLKILEIGAGQGEHTKFVKFGYLQYLLTDIDPIRLAKIDLDLNNQISTQLMTANAIDFPDNSFDRIIVTCVLAHLLLPEEALQEWKRVLKPGGNLTIYIPCEPGIALRIFRILVSKRKAKNLGFEGYSLMIARDHINSASNLKELIKHIFNESRIIEKYRPFPLPTWYFNLFKIVEIWK